MNTTSGFSINGGKPGIRLRMRLPITRSISIGNPIRRAQGTVIVVRNRSRSVASISSIGIEGYYNPNGSDPAGYTECQ